MPAAGDGRSHGRRMKCSGGLHRASDAMASGGKQRGGGCKCTNRASLMGRVRIVAAVRRVLRVRVGGANHQRVGGGRPDRHLRYNDPGEQQLQGKSISGSDSDPRPDRRSSPEGCQRLHSIVPTSCNAGPHRRRGRCRARTAPMRHSPSRQCWSLRCSVCRGDCAPRYSPTGRCPCRIRP